MLTIALSLLLATSTPTSPTPSTTSPALTAPPPSLSTVTIEKGLGPALRPIAAVFAELPGVVVTATDQGFLAVLAAKEHDGSNPIHVEVYGGVVCPVPAPKNIFGGRAEPGYIWAQYDVRYRRIDPATGAKRTAHSLLGEGRRLQMTKEAFWASTSTWKELRLLRDAILFPGRDDTVRALITPAFAGIADVVDATADEVGKSPDGEVFAIVVDGQRFVVDASIACRKDGMGSLLEVIVRSRDLVNKRRIGTWLDTFRTHTTCDGAVRDQREKIEASLKTAVSKLAPRSSKP